MQEERIQLVRYKVQMPCGKCRQGKMVSRHLRVPNAGRMMYLNRCITGALAVKPEAIDVNDIYRCGGCMSGSNRHLAAPDFDGVRFMFVGDARRLTGDFILETIGLGPGDLDLVCGGPPCQGFSKSGKQDVMDPRNSLVLDFARLVVEMKPKTVCMENVPGILDMVTPEGIPVMDAVARVLSDGDYGDYDALRRSILSTSGCGYALKDTRGTRRGAKKKVENEVEPEAAAQGTLF